MQPLAQQMKEMQLYSLFEIIRAINDNASEENLYKIYRFTLHSDQSIEKLALFVFDEFWGCKAQFGTKQDYQKIELPKNISQIQRTIIFENDFLENFAEFDALIPIKHKETTLAYVFLGKSDKNKHDLWDLDFIEALSNIIIVAIENKKFARKELKQQALRRQLDIAKEVQTLLFPKKLPYSDKLRIVANYQPHHSVGGDYYDYLPQENKFLVCIADVSGKGVPAAILMSNFQASLRILVKQNFSLHKIVHELNEAILQNSGGSHFITAFLAEYNWQTQKLSYINAGHNPPLLVHKQKNTELTKGTTILGAFEALPFVEVGEIEALDEFFLFCFTDGLTETFNEKEEEFGIEKLYDCIKEYFDIDQKQLHEKILERLHDFKGKNDFSDDITLLSCFLKNS